MNMALMEFSDKFGPINLSFKNDFNFWSIL